MAGQVTEFLSAFTDFWPSVDTVPRLSQTGHRLSQAIGQSDIHIRHIFKAAIVVIT